MLYISGLATRGKFYVTDTDDGITESVTRSHINHLVLDLHMKIAGVTIIADGINKPYTKIEVVSMSSTAIQTKLKMLRGVDMKVNNGVLSTCSFDRFDNSFSIRLSDYCSSIGKYCFRVYNRDPKSGAQITIILDDKLSIAPYAFNNINYGTTSLIFDLREVTDNKLASKVYTAFSSYRKSACYIVLHNIIDNDERYFQNVVNTLMRHGIDYDTGVRNKNYFINSAGVDYSSYALDFARRKYRKKVIDIFNQKLTYTFEKFGRDDYIDDRYNALIDSHPDSATNLFWFVSSCSDIGEAKYYIMRDYMLYFANPNDDAEICNLFAKYKEELFNDLKRQYKQYKG